MSEEPSELDLHRAWTEALTEIGGARSDAIQKLRALRSKKTTWVGEHENLLRLALDDFLALFEGD